MQLEHTQTINPFFHSRTNLPKPKPAMLPPTPINASPVPHLTSLYYFADAGPYDRQLEPKTKEA